VQMSIRSEVRGEIAEVRIPRYEFTFGLLPL
jgi:hypothetical protein